MKKALIITLYGNNNYGNKLQNYALQEVLKKELPKCEISTIKVKYRNSNIIKYCYRIIKDYIDSFKKISRRENIFINFSNDFINYYKKIKSTNSLFKIKEFDYYFFGSDQIWNPYSCGWTKLFLGASTNYNIAYSASFGVDYIPLKYRNNYSKNLKKFVALSVREESGKKIIEDLTGRTDVEVLVDPTMLLTSEEWEKVSKKPKEISEDEKYILNYFLGNLSDERKKEIEKVAKKNNCRIINLLDKSEPLYNSGPSEFLWLEKHAFLICTDSFHSSVFAILYNRPFIIFEREQEEIVNMNSRIDTLINTFKLKNRLYTGKITKENLNYDYTEAYKILEKEREKSKKFLEKALDIK